MRGGPVILACLALAACGAEEVVSVPAGEQALLAMTAPEYLGVQSLAQQVAANCADVSYDLGTAQRLTQQRTDAGRGGLSALGLENAVAIERDVAARSLMARYQLTSLTQETCSAANAEILGETALGVLLKQA